MSAIKCLQIMFEILYSPALFFNRFVNEIFGNLFYGTFGRSRYFFWFLIKKNLKMFIFHYKTCIWNLKLTGKTMENGNFKHVFSRDYDFKFTNLLKMRQSLPLLGWIRKAQVFKCTLRPYFLFFFPARNELSMLFPYTSFPASWEWAHSQTG